MTCRRWASLAVALVVLGGCGGRSEGDPTGRYVTLSELFTSEDAPADNLDSLAFWPPGPWVIATAKSTDQLVVLDADDGGVVRRFGERGDGLGQFRRPNGVAVLGDVVFVTERDNHRVQLLRLPTLQPLAVVGGEVLRAPYGLAVVPSAEGTVELYVTDNYLGAGQAPPPPHQLGERVKHFRLTWAEGGGVDAELVRTFGDTSGEGVLTTVESIAADVLHDRLLIADEAKGVQNIKVYTLSGRFTGQLLGVGRFAAEPEGIALIERGEGGYWIASDQRKDRTFFHLFSRDDLRYVGSAVGEMTANTDGIAVGEREGKFRLFAVHDDRSVVAFSVRALLSNLQLPEN